MYCMSIYIFFITISVLFISYSSPKRVSPFYFGIMIMVLFAGFRYKIGIDYVSYWEFYLGSDISTSEPGHKYFCILLNSLGFGPQMMFLIYAFFSIATICLFFKNNNPRYCYITCLLFFVCDFFNLINIMRQYVALPFFLYSVKYIYRRSFLKYLICLIFGSLFHYSLILLFPFYWILYVNMSKKKMVAILLIAIFSPYLISIKSLLVHIPVYGVYLDSLSDVNGSANLGLGFLSRIIILFVVIFIKDRLEKINKISIIMVNSIFFSVIFCLIFIDFIVFLRISYYFQIFFPLAITSIISCYNMSSRMVIISVVFVYSYLLLSSSLSSPDLIPYDYNLNVFDKNIISR